MARPDPEKARLADAIEIAAWIDLYSAAPVAIVHTLGLEVIRVADACCFVARGIPIALFNRCLGLGNEHPAREADVDAVLSTFDAPPPSGPTLVGDREAHRASWIQHGPASRTPEIATWLERRGLRPAPRSWAKLLRDATPPEQVTTSFDIREVTKSDAKAFAHALADAHGMPSKLAEWTEPLIGRPGWIGFAAFDRDRIIAGGMVFVQGERAWLGLGGTIAAHRQKGAQSALLGRRIQSAIDAGAKTLAVEAAEVPASERSTSYANVVRAGFRQVASRSNYERA